MGRRLYSQALLDILRLIASMVEAARLTIYSRTSSSLREFEDGAFGVLLGYYIAQPPCDLEISREEIDGSSESAPTVALLKTELHASPSEKRSV